MQALRFFGLLLFAVTSVLSSADQAYGQVVRVEEDWEMSLGTPDQESDSPQVTMAMSPTGSDTEYCSFELNHQSQPAFYSGGLHLHAWDGEFVLGSAHDEVGVTMHHANERVAWTQALSVSDGSLTYEVINGTSQTWGDFGGENLRLSLQTSLSDLNQYDSSTSLQNSGVGYGANRVMSLKLKRVRLITASGEVSEFPLNHDVLQGN